MFDLSFKNFVWVGELVHLLVNLCHLIFMQFAEWDGLGDLVDDPLGVVFVFAKVGELCDFHGVLWLVKTERFILRQLVAQC